MILSSKDMQGANDNCLKEKLQITTIKGEVMSFTICDYVNLHFYVVFKKSYNILFKPFQIHRFTKQNINNSVYVLNNQNVIFQ